MKMNKKLLVSAMSVAMAAGVVGSISGTVAWYQYSTKATASMVAASIGGNHHMKVAVTAATATEAPTEASAWKSELKTADIEGALGYASTKHVQFAPVTPALSASLANNVALPTTFKTNPVYGYAAQEKWGNATLNNEYIQFKVWVKTTKQEDGDTAAVAESKKVGISNVTLQQDAADASNHSDVSSALRVHIACGDKYALVSKAGGSTNLYGNLDLNGDGVADKALKYEWEEAGSDLVYGVNSATETCYAQSSTDLLTTDDPVTDTISGGIEFGTTDEDGLLAFTITVWLEGWQMNLGSASSALWDLDYAGSISDIGLTFATGKVSA